MSRNSFQICGLGQCTLDYLGAIDSYPPVDVKCEFRDLTTQGGGPAATALVALSRWGVSCAFCGVVGDDPFGEAILESLVAEGVDASDVLVRPGAVSQFAFISAEACTGRRNIFYRKTSGAPPSINEIPIRLIEDAQVFHTDGLFGQACLAAARAARKAGTIVSADAGSLREGMLELAGECDHFIASEAFARSFIGRDDPEGACEKLAKICPGVVGVTLGAKGSLFLENGKLVRMSAWPVEAIDTTGCGDVFHAGYIYGLLKKWPLEGRIDFASWAASRVSLRLGGRAGIPDPSDFTPRENNRGRS